MIKSTFTISFLILISRIAGFIRDVLIARFIGANLLSDVFFAAFRLPNFFRRVFAEGAVNSVFIPLFLEIKKENNQEEAINFAKKILFILIVSITCLLVLMQIFMPTIVKILVPGFADNKEKFELSITLCRITIFYLLSISVVSLYSSIFNSLNKFAISFSTPIILNLTLIVSLYIANNHKYILYFLSWGVFIAGLLQLIWVIVFSIREKIIIYPKFLTKKNNPNIKLFFKRLVPSIIGSNLMQMNLLIDTIMSSFISNAVSYLYYATRISQLPLAMIGIAINTVLLPALSKEIKKNNLSQIKKIQNQSFAIAIFFLTPASMGLFFLSYEIIFFLFHSEKFGIQETIAVSSILQIYALALPSHIFIKIFEPYFFAKGNTKTPMFITIICVLINICFNLLLIKPLGYIGIAISSLIASYCNLLIIYLYLNRKNEIHLFQKQEIIKNVIFLLKIISSSIIMIFIIDLVHKYNSLSLLYLTIFIGIIVYILCNLFFFFPVLKKNKDKYCKMLW